MAQPLPYYDQGSPYQGPPVGYATPQPGVPPQQGPPPPYPVQNYPPTPGGVIYIQVPQAAVPINNTYNYSGAGQAYSVTPYQNAEDGGSPQSSDSSNGRKFAHPDFAEEKIRRGFVRKVYLILTTQLTITCGMIAVFIFVPPVTNWIQHEGQWFHLFANVLFGVFYLVIVCGPKSMRRKSPGNYIILIGLSLHGIFLAHLQTLTSAIATAATCSYYHVHIVLLAVGTTALLCLVVTLFAVTTKIDFTRCTGCLCAILIVFILYTIAVAVMHYVWGYNKLLNIVLGGFGTLLFSLFLIYDTQRVIGGKSGSISPEEYIEAAVQIYVDIILIFLYVLGLYDATT